MDSKDFLHFNFWKDNCECLLLILDFFLDYSVVLDQYPWKDKYDDCVDLASLMKGIIESRLPDVIDYDEL